MAEAQGLVCIFAYGEDKGVASIQAGDTPPQKTTTTKWTDAISRYGLRQLSMDFPTG